MNSDHSRRRFLELAGTGTAISVAGCNALPGGSTETTTDGTDAMQDPGTATNATTQGTASGAGQTAGGEKVVAVALRPDQQKLKAKQKEIQSKVKAGNLSRKEAAKQYQAVQTKLRSEAIATFEGRIGSSSLAVAESLDKFGLLLVSGPAATLIDALGYPEVNALLPTSSFQQAKARLQQQTTTSP